jgi:hypothetical protein
VQDIIDFGIYNNLEWKKLSTEYLHGLADMGNTQAKECLERIYSSPVETQTIGFGKFSGSLWVDLDVDYLYWILNNVDSLNIKFTLATKALEYIQSQSDIDEFGDVIYVD